MTAQELELAIDAAQHTLRALTEARTMRWHKMDREAVRFEQSAFVNLETLALNMGREMRDAEAV